MRAARTLAYAFTALCLVLAAVTLTSSTTLTFTAGSSSTETDCGSAAFPTALDGFDNTDEAANCAGQTSASVALYSVLLAGLGLAAIAATSRGTSSRRDSERAPERDSSSS